MSHKLGCIEAGGTKFICAIGDTDGTILEKCRIDTRHPDLTMPEVIDFFKAMEKRYQISTIGLGSFGPIDPNTSSKSYGYITTTPKQGWNNFDLVGNIKKHFDIPIQFDTDVNAAALGEYYWGSAQNLTDFIYLTIGTGIGGGVISNGRLIHGVTHPELGHILIPQDKAKDNFAGVCQYHGNCLEGLASGTAIKERWGVDSAAELPKDHPAWDLESDYLAYALANFIVILSPQKIILGGGVMKQEHLFPLIREKVLKLLAGYVTSVDSNNIDSLIVPPGLGDNAGICGALALAKYTITNHPAK